MDIAKADCVIALSFGKRTAKTQADPNVDIAKIASSFDLPIITQEEISAYCRQPAKVITKPKGYLDTWNVLSGSRQIMDKYDYRYAVLVTHEAHTKRAKQQAMRLGIEITTVRKIAKWDQYSSQWWTRTPFYWQIHELATIPWLKIQGRI